MERSEILEKDKLNAFLHMIIVQPVEENQIPGLIIIGEARGLEKGIVLSTGSEVPEIEKGDLAYFTECSVIEEGTWAVHFEDVVAYRRYSSD